MSAIFKTLTGIIPSNQTAIVFTDNMIVDDSILDVFFSNDDIVVDDMTMTGNSVTVTISPQNYNVGVALFINNCEVFTPYDDTEVLNRLTIVETDTDTLNTEIGELDTEVGEINTELDALTNTVNNKQDKLPDVVNDKYLHTNATTGELEWSSVQGGNVSIIKTLRITVQNHTGFNPKYDYPTGVNFNDYILLNYQECIPNYQYTRIGHNSLQANQFSTTNDRFFIEMREEGLYLFNNVALFDNKEIIVIFGKVN